MREYGPAEIRNVAVVGHGASGKTSLVDALAFAAGSSKRHGAVRDGTSLTDFSPEEAERGYSISLGAAYVEWMNCKINLLDCPGYLDFQGDALAGLVAATAGIEVGTEKMFREAVRRDDPVMFVVTMMDKEHADFDAIYRQIKDRLTSKVILVEVPLGEGATFRGVMNLFTQKAYVYPKGAKSGEYEEADIPTEERARFDRYRQELVEAISATDDTLLER